jgi:hypothetical protein
VDAAGVPLAAFGSLGLAALIVLGLFLALRSGQLVTKTTHEQRLADKDELKDFYRETAERAITTTAANTESVGKMISDLRAITVAVTSNNGGSPR